MFLTYFLITIGVLYLLFSVIFWIRISLLRKRANLQLDKLSQFPKIDLSKKFLDAKRKVTDPVADRVVAEIMVKNELSEVNHLFSLLSNDLDQLPDEAPDELKRYIKETEILPDWANPELIAYGQQVYLRYGAWISMLLCYKSLPECYACAKGAEVLLKTGRLNEQHGSFDAFSRRIAETAQFVMFTMSPNGLSSSGKGIRAAQKVRLIHAIIRYYLKKHGWDVQKYGEPVNHEDIAGTLMAFSALVLEGLEIIGIRLNQLEKEAYVHCWRVVGHIMGLEDDILPGNSTEALALGHAILNDQIAESEAGKTLTNSLLNFQAGQYAVFLTKEDDEAMLRMMMGSEVSDLLGIPEVQNAKIDTIKKRVRKITKIANVLENMGILFLSIQLFSRFSLRWVLSRMTSKKGINFYLPASLTRDWKQKLK